MHLRPGTCDAFSDVSDVELCCLKLVAARVIVILADVGPCEQNVLHPAQLDKRLLQIAIYMIQILN